MWGHMGLVSTFSCPRGFGEAAAAFPWCALGLLSLVLKPLRSPESMDQGQSCHPKGNGQPRGHVPAPRVTAGDRSMPDLWPGSGWGCEVLE